MTKFAEAFPPPDIMIDRRDYARRNHQDGGERPWHSITGICLHQTACVLGERPERYDTLGAHFGVMRSGRVIRVHDETRLVWHGNRWNAGTIGIEVDGLFEGVEGDPHTVWDDPTTPVHEKGMPTSTVQDEATKQLCRWLCTRVQANGGEIKVIVAHRQSSKDRRNDPGSARWKAIALPLMDELGLGDGGHGFELGGYPIPFEWDPRKVGIKY